MAISLVCISLCFAGTISTVDTHVLSLQSLTKLTYFLTSWDLSFMCTSIVFANNIGVK